MHPATRQRPGRHLGVSSSHIRGLGEPRSSMTQRLLSVVVPIYNEEGLLDELYGRLTAAVVPLAQRYRCEFVFVDDGSADRSLEILRGFAERDARVRVLSFSRNFGHQIAITAGIDDARGDAVVA